LNSNFLTKLWMERISTTKSTISLDGNTATADEITLPQLFYISPRRRWRLWQRSNCNAIIGTGGIDQNPWSINMFCQICFIIAYGNDNGKMEMSQWFRIYVHSDWELRHEASCWSSNWSIRQSMMSNNFCLVDFRAVVATVTRTMSWYVVLQLIAIGNYRMFYPCANVPFNPFDRIFFVLYHYHYINIYWNLLI